MTRTATVELTDDELRHLDGHCRPEIQAWVDWAKRQPHRTEPGPIDYPPPGTPWPWDVRLARYLATYHRASLDDVEPTDTPGYWQFKRPCTGCTHPADGHFPQGCGIHHTVSYFDDRQEGGRFTSPYRTWREARAAAGLPTEPVARQAALATRLDQENR